MRQDMHRSRSSCPTRRYTVWVWAIPVMLAIVPRVVLGSCPTLDDFHVQEIPLDGHDAPAITNHWIWAQADGRFGKGILNMEDVRAGAAPMLQGTMVVRVNGQEVVASGTADWRPNQVVRRGRHDGLELTGTVRTAEKEYALLSRLKIRNPGKEPRVVTLQLDFATNCSNVGTAETPDVIEQKAGAKVYHFGEFAIPPGHSRQIRCVHLYRGNSEQLSSLLSQFESEWAASDCYWNAVLEDAFTPGPGLYLSGGMPRLVTEDAEVKRLYRFGVVTLLMLLKNDPDRRTDTNWYGTSMPDASYGTESFVWDVGYASDVLALMDPIALRNVLEHWAAMGVHEHLCIPYNDGPSVLGPRFYAASGSLFFLSAWNYINYTGDYGWLDEAVAGKTMLGHLRHVADWHKTRPQWNGLAHYGEEMNLFDDDTVPGYHHFVAAPNAADVWINRRLADIYERLYRDVTTARRLREEADRIVRALLEHLYNSEGEHAGTWKQRHMAGDFLQIRHSWDFMNAGSFLANDLSDAQRQQMRDWYANSVVRFESDDIWVIAQDPRDGNNGPHQMEHNGRGAYPAWPYHQGWALKELGFHGDVARLLRLLCGVTRYGAIGQGHFPNGRRCRSGWASAAGATSATFVLDNLFDIRPTLGVFHPRPRLDGFDNEALLENVVIQSVRYRVTKHGCESMPSRK